MTIETACCSIKYRVFSRRPSTAMKNFAGAEHGKDKMKTDFRLANELRSSFICLIAEELRGRHGAVQLESKHSLDRAQVNCHHQTDLQTSLLPRDRLSPRAVPAGATTRPIVVGSVEVFSRTHGSWIIRSNRRLVIVEAFVTYVQQRSFDACTPGRDGPKRCVSDPCVVANAVAKR